MGEVLSTEQVALLASKGIVYDPSEIADQVQVLETTTTASPDAPIQLPEVSTQPIPLVRPTDAILAQPGAPKQFKSSKGNIYTLAKPVRPVAMKIARLLGYDSGNQGLLLYFRAISHIHAINGRPMTPLETREDYETIAELLGDDDLEQILVQVYSLQIEEAVNREATKKS